jgi:hypothetical protein
VPLSRPLRILLRTVFLVWMTVCLLPAAHALGPHGDVFVGFSGTNTDGGYGWQASAHLRVWHFVGVEGDFGGFGYGQSSSYAKTYTYMAGPRVTLNLHRVRVFAHAVGGRAEPSGGNVESGAFLYAIGGGLDFPVISHLGWRVGADFLQAPSVTYGAGGNGIGRFSTGPVFRF